MFDGSIENVLFGKLLELNGKRPLPRTITSFT